MGAKALPSSVKEKVRDATIELPDRRIVALGDTLMISSDRGDTWQPVSAPLPQIGSDGGPKIG